MRWTCGTGRRVSRHLGLRLSGAIFLEASLDAAEDAQIALVHEEAAAFVDLEGEIRLGERDATEGHQNAQREHRRFRVAIGGVDQDLERPRPKRHRNA